MLVPLSWLAEFVQIPPTATPQSISDAFVQVGFEVESFRITGSDIQGPVVVGRVLAIEELLGHKKPIRFVTLDCGEGSDRQVICGARNFSIGDLVVVAKPGSVLPGDFKIASRMTYERLSDGMICSTRELGLGDDHSGIVVLPDGSASVGKMPGRYCKQTTSSLTYQSILIVVMPSRYEGLLENWQGPFEPHLKIQRNVFAPFI